MNLSGVPFCNCISGVMLGHNWQHACLTVGFSLGDSTYLYMFRTSSWECGSVFVYFSHGTSLCVCLWSACLSPAA